jgi:hypothetical protein
MPLIEKATAYVLGALLQNEEFKKIPQDFISASVEWVRSWFLKDDPKTEAKLSSDKSIDYKHGVVESKLEDLLENPQFQQELESQLAEYERHAAAVQHISNRTASIENSQVNTGGGAIHQAGRDIQIIHHYASQPSGEAAKPVVPVTKPIAGAAVKEALQKIVGAGETKNAIDWLNELSTGHEEFRKLVLAQSNKWDAVKRQEMMGTLSFSEAMLERNKIVSAVLDLIGELG